jgi:tetratricopeptide (TPR) repeat protein
MDWQTPLLVSAMIFAAFLIFKMRPAVTPTGRASAAALNEAKRRLESAKDDHGRAIALADAADACAHLGRTNSAVGFYLRALRADPTSTQIVERAGAALIRRPAALELLMWRHLAAHPWQGEHRAAAVAGLRTLARAYGKRRRYHVRAQAIEHALDALGVSPSLRAPSKSDPSGGDGSAG